MQSLSDHYIIATTTDYAPHGGITGYHVMHIDIMPIYIGIAGGLAFYFFCKLFLKILQKIRKNK